MKIIYPELNNREHNITFSKMKMPARGFVQLVVIANNNSDKVAYDMFNVPYNYFEDFFINFGAQGIDGTFAILNPFPISKLSKEKKRFEDFQKLLTMIMKSTKGVNKTSDGNNITAQTYIRYGWCDQDNTYYVSNIHRIGITQMTTEFVNEGFRTKINFIDYGQYFSYATNIDVNFTSLTKDLLGNVAGYLYLKFGIKMDFKNENDAKYRIWNKDALSNPQKTADIQKYKELLDSGNVNEAIDLVRKNYFNEDGVAARASLVGNDSSSISVMSGSVKTTITTLLNSICRSILKRDHIGENVPPNEKEILLYVFNSTIDDERSSESFFNRFLERGGFERESIPHISKTIQGEMNIDLYFEKSGPNDITVIKKEVGEVKSKEGKIDYSKLLPSMYGGIYYYFPNIKFKSANANINTTNRAVQSNVISLGLSSEMWVGYYLSGEQEMIGIDRRDGRAKSIKTKATSDPGATTLKHVATSTDLNNNDNASAIAEYLFVNKMKNMLYNKGTIEVFGDPTVSFQMSTVGRYIYLLVHTPNGDVIKELTGFYFISGYSHKISGGRYITTLNLMLQMNSPFATPVGNASVKQPEPTEKPPT